MLDERLARRSLARDISDIFTSGSIFSTVYNVYDEDDLRAGTTPVRQFVYILDADVKFEQKHLPVIALATDYATDEFQLGSNAQGLCDAEVYILGRNRGERDDFATAIMKYVKSIHIRDFDTDGYPILATVPINSQGRREWDSEKIALTEELRTEGSLLNGVRLWCQFWIFTA